MKQNIYFAVQLRTDRNTEASSVLALVESSENKLEINKQRYYSITAYFIGGVFLILAIIYHFNLVVFPYQLEYREGAMLQSTVALKDGINIYEYHNIPQYFNVLGILYNLIMVPFMYLPVDGLVMHRIISAIFLFATIWLFYRVQLKAEIPKWLAAVSCVLIYLTYIYGVVPVARPDAFGTFLFSAALLYPYLKNYSWSSLMISVLLSVLALYTKLYFVLAAPILLTYVFLFLSKRKALIAGVIYFVGVTLSIWIADLLMPAYFRSVVLTVSNAATYHYSNIYLQVRAYFLQQNIGYFVLFIIFCLSIIFKYRHSLWRNTLQYFKSLRIKFSIDNGLVEILNPPSLFFFISCVSFALYILKLGGHGGSFLTYFIEIFSSFFIVELNRQVIVQNMNRWIVIGCLAIALISSYKILNGIAEDKSDFIKAEKIIAAHTDPLCTPALASTMIEYDEPLIDNGLSEYFKYYPKIKPDNIFKHIYDASPADQRKWRSYIKTVSQNIAEKKYDVVLFQKDSWLLIDSLLNEYYTTTDSLILDMPQYALEQWKVYVYKPALPSRF